MPPSDQEKSRLRHQLRQRRRQLSASERERAGTAAASYLQQLPGWPDFSHIALYLPIDGELDTRAIAGACRQIGANLYLPRINGTGTMQLLHWDEHTPLLINAYGIAEPAAGARVCHITELDVLLAPLVGWDKQGNRLGMGGGYYDRMLAKTQHPPLFIGLAYDFQCMEEGLPVRAWDIQMDGVLTDKGLHIRTADPT
ncbi:MAG: 5-formyltetrahydrofolate cyclo-ligase [Parahaliea sp.]